MDISFLLPTIRDWAKYGQRVVNSIYAMDNPKQYTYEILVSSPNQVEGSCIDWIQDNDLHGPLNSFNKLANLSNSRYLACCVDDHIVSRSFFKTIDFLDGEEFKKRQYKICTIKSGGTCYVPVHLPFCPDQTKADEWVKWPVMRFPIVHTDTVKYGLNRRIFSERFIMHHADIALAVYLGVNGEPPIEFQEAEFKEFVFATNNKHDELDERSCIEFMRHIRPRIKYE